MLTGQLRLLILRLGPGYIILLSNLISNEIKGCYSKISRDKDWKNYYYKILNFAQIYVKSQTNKYLTNCSAGK